MHDRVTRAASATRVQRFASMWTRRVLVSACGIAWAVTSGAARAEEAPAAVTCRVRDDARGREFALRQVAPAAAGQGPAAVQWQLSMREGENDATIDIGPPGARPTITATTATLSYHNANGGRYVELDVSPTGSRLDVWVDYGLDVNIEPDLDPRVDRMNTEGPLTALECTTNPAGAQSGATDRTPRAGAP